MKAIANSMEPKAVGPGFLGRAVGPVAGFGFEHLFTMTQTAVAKDALVADAEVSGEVPMDGHLLPPVDLSQFAAGHMPVVFSDLDARFADAILSQADASGGVAMALASDPENALQMDQPMHAPGLSATEPHKVDDIATADFALPQASDLLSENALLSEAADGLDSLTQTSDHKNQNVLALDVVEEGTEISAAPLAFDALGADDDATAAPLAPRPEPADTPRGPRNPRAEVGALLDVPEALQRLKDGAVKPPPAHPTPNEAPLRIAPTDVIEGEHVIVEAPLNARPRLGQDDGAKSLTIPPILKRQSTAQAHAAGKGETTPVAVVSTPSSPPVTAATPPNPLMAAVTGQGAHSEKPAGQMLAKVTSDVEAGIARRTRPLKSETAQGATGRADRLMSEVLQEAPERVDPILATTAVARAPVLVTSAPQQVAPALPPAVALNLRQADWGKQFIAQIERMVTDGLQRIEVSLRPKNLGEVQVVLDLRGDQATVHLVCETAAAARLLMGAEDKLAQVLDQSGYRLSGFSAQEQGTGTQTGQQGQQSPRRSRSTADTNTREEPSDAAATNPYSADRGRSNGINVLA